MSIGGDDLLAQIENDNSKLGVFLRRYVVPAIERTATNAGVSPTGTIPAPSQPEKVNVTTQGEYMQITVDHSAPIQRGIQYITHISTDPEFKQPIVLDHGSSRCPPPIPLPSKDSAGNPISYHVRTIAQYPGSHPSPPTYHGGDYPAPVTMGGTTQMTLQSGTGSGTGAANGQQSAAGLGKTLFRGAVGPKRNVPNGA